MKIITTPCLSQSLDAVPANVDHGSSMKHVKVSRYIIIKMLNSMHTVSSRDKLLVS